MANSVKTTVLFAFQLLILYAGFCTELLVVMPTFVYNLLRLFVAPLVINVFTGDCLFEALRRTNDISVI